LSLNLEVKFDQDKEVLVVKPEGDVDIYTSIKFKNEVVSSFEERNVDILIDGSKLEYLDSTGLGALISLLKMVRETDNGITIENLKPNIRKLFNITELDKLFTIRGEEDD
jgi:anti-sigma B factor antagonist